jgi:Protein of unknown function (DUF1800)
MFKYFRAKFLLSFLLLSAATSVATGETPTQIRAKEWQQQKRVFRFPPGYIPVPASPPRTVGEHTWGPSSVGNYDPKRLMAGHLLRRLGFGPNAQEMNAVLHLGIPAYIEMQLNPSQIEDSRVNSLLPKPPKDFYADYEWIQRWFTRMVYSRRQLQEKMTLILHELFATSDAKVGVGSYMHDQEEFLRRNCFGDFNTLLVGGNLVGAPSNKKAIAIATPVFTGCLNCNVTASMMPSGGIGNKVWLLAWYANKQNTVELIMSEEKR